MQTVGNQMLSFTEKHQGRLFYWQSSAAVSLFRFQASVALDELTASKTLKMTCRHCFILVLWEVLINTEVSLQTFSDLKPVVKPDLNDKGSMPIIPSMGSFTWNTTHTYNLYEGSDFRSMKCSYLKWNRFKDNRWVSTALTRQTPFSKEHF